MRVKYKGSIEPNNNWEDLAKKAVELSFRNDFELDPSKSHNYAESSSLLEKSMEVCTSSWPFLRYAELCRDYESKISTYERSVKVEATSLAIARLVYLNSVLDNLDKAKYWLDQLISLYPNDPYIKNFMFLKDTFVGKDKVTRCSLVPYDFDPVFYREAHKELGLQSDIESIFHFIEYGRNELRDYKRPIDIPVVKVVLFTQYYACDEQTKNDIVYCLNKNIENPLINELVLFYDQDELKNELIELSQASDKIRIVKIEERLTFKQWFEFSSQNYSESWIKVLANSDIYFDSTLSFLYNLEYRKDIFYSCSRVDLDDSGNLIPSRITNSKDSPLINNYTSQDCWVYKEDLLPFKSDFKLGYENCDVFLKDHCLASGCHFLNLFNHINCVHVDRRSIKVRGKYEFSPKESSNNSDYEGDWVGFALAALEEKDQTSAIKLFRRSIELKPSASWPYIKLAAMLNDTKEKIELLTEAIKIDNNCWGYIMLIRSFLSTNDYYKANDLLSTLEELVANEAGAEADVLKEVKELKSYIEIKLRTKIYLRVYGNLFKRLRTINSFYSFAKQHKKDLFVYWGEGFQWSSQKFDDLFEKVESISFVEKEFIETNSKNTLDLSLLMNAKGKDLSDKEILEHLKKESFTYFGDECLEDVIDGFSVDNNFYQLLVPKLSLDQSYKVDAILKQFVDGKTFGIFIDNPDTSLLKKEIDKQIEEEPKSVFFVSCNRADLLSSLIEDYPERIVFQEKEFEDTESYEMLGDQTNKLVDLFLLASTNKIISCPCNEITNVSSKMSGVPLIELPGYECKEKTLKPNLIRVHHQLGWQTPAFTEKQAFINHDNNYLCPSDKIYIACPWASIIDFIVSRFQNSIRLSDFYESQEIRNYLENHMRTNGYDSKKLLDYDTHTVCQHIFWHKLIRFWVSHGIKNVHASHLTKNFVHVDGIKFYPWFLVGSNIENPKRNFNMTFKRDRKYLCSFIGATTKAYRSNIRQKINDSFIKLKKETLKKDVYVSLNNTWFYEGLVYENQINQRQIKQAHLEQQQFDTIRFNTILSNSVFSLCPEGTGPNTIRLWESMAIGSIPVLFENDWERPSIDNLSWDEFSITIRPNQVEDVFYILNEIPKEKIEEMRTNCINAYNSIRTRTCF